MGVEASRFVRMARGDPEALTDAWANLYTEFAIAIVARRSGTLVPAGLLRTPDVVDGARFVEAAAAAASAGGTWHSCSLAA